MKYKFPKLIHVFICTAFVLSLITPPAQGQPVATVIVFNDPIPPVLNPIGNKTVLLGQQLVIDLKASDSNNDPLQFSAAPLPLPANSKLETLDPKAGTGRFTFKPSTSQVGKITLKFIVSDGSLTDDETITITVNKQAVNKTELSGRVLDTNDFVKNKITPVVGATVQLLGTSFKTTSDTQGNFKLTGTSGIPSGKQILDIDSSTANKAPNNAPYAGFREEIILIKDVNNVVSRPFFLPRIDISSLTKVNPAKITVVKNPNLNITLTVPPNTAKKGSNNFTGQLSISLVPEAMAPAALPEELKPGTLITLQPVGVNYATPVPITFPNTENLAVGNKMDLWSLDAKEGVFHKVGVGEVKASGMIETISGGIRANDWHFFMSPTGVPGGGGNDDNHDQPRCCKAPTKSLTALSSGDLTVDHTLTGYRSLEKERTLRMVYHSTHADPRPVISANVTVPVRAAVPPTVSAKLSVADISQGVEVFTDTSKLDENKDETIRQVVQFDGTGFVTGRYPYKLTLSNNYPQSSMSTIMFGNVLINNQQKSPFGAGWTVDGVQRLYLDKSGDALIGEGDGSAKLFRLMYSGPGLRAYWPFDDKSNPTRDISGGHDGLLLGASFISDNIVALPKNLAAISFDNPGEQLTANDAPALNFTKASPMSIVLWLKQTEKRSTFHVYGKRDQCNLTNLNYQFAQDPSNKAHFVSAGKHFSAGRDLPFNKWTHVAVTYDGKSTLRIYFDGVEVAKSQQFTLGGANPSPLKIGSSGTCSAANTFPGHIDELYMYHRELSSAEVAALKNARPSLTLGYVAPVGEFSQLVKNMNNTFTRTLKDGTKINFDAQGFHTSTVDRNGNTTSYAYDTGGRLKTITDPVALVTTFNYKTNGLIDTIVDPSNRTTRFLHDSLGNLTRITDPDGEYRGFIYGNGHQLQYKDSKRRYMTEYKYNFAGRNVQSNRPDSSTRKVAPSQTVGLVDLSTGFGTKAKPAPVTRPAAAVSTFTDGNNNTIRYMTGRFGAVRSAEDSKKRTTMIERNANGDPLSITYPKGNGVKFVYDVLNSDIRGRGNVLEIRRKTDMTKPDNNAVDFVTKFSYESKFNQIKTITDPMGRVTKSTYDYELPTTDPRYGTKGNVVKIEFPKVTVGVPTVWFRYNAQGQVIEVQDPNGNITKYDYFPTVGTLGTQGNLKGIIQDPAGINAKTSFQYDMYGNPKKITDAESHVTNLLYDNMNRIKEETNPLNFKTKYFYDAAGSLERIERQADTTASVWQITKFDYDKIENLETVTDPLNRVTTFKYDLNENLKSILDAETHLSEYEYDERNLLFKITDANAPVRGVTEYLYDDNGNLKQIKDANANVTKYAFDLFDRLWTTTYADNKFSKFEYDKNSNFKKHTTPSTAVIEYDYDELNRLTDKKFPATASLNTKYTYDLGSRLKTADNAAAKNAFTYDKLNRIRTNTQNLVPSSYTLTYQYDKVGNRKQIKYPSGKTIDITYDANDRMDIIKVNNTNFLDYNYDPLDRRLTKTYPLVPSSIITTYNFDLANQLKTIKNQVTGAAKAFSQFDYTLYDKVSNRKSLTIKRVGAQDQQFSYTYNNIYELTNVTGNQTHSFKYDKVGNRTNHNNTLYTPNNLNQYTRVGAQAFTYDNNGNLTNDGKNRHVYDEENRLSTATTSSTTSTYSYDAFNRRVAKTVNGTTTYFIYDGDEVIEERNATGGLLADYVMGSGIDEVLTMSRGGKDYYYHYDGLGSVSDISDSSGKVIESYDYDVYGQPSKLSKIGNPYYFTGRRLDPESGKYYYRARMYDPTIGRFLQRDPIGYFDGMNLFSYVNNNPVNFVDPSGEQWIPPWLNPLLPGPNPNIESLLKERNKLLNELAEVELKARSHACKGNNLTGSARRRWGRIGSGYQKRIAIIKGRIRSIEKLIIELDNLGLPNVNRPGVT